MHTASITATDTAIRRVRRGETVRIISTSTGYLFEVCGQPGQRELVYIPHNSRLFLNDEVPDEVRLDYEIGFRLHQAVLISNQDGHPIGIMFRYENDRDKPIPLSALSVPPITFAVLEIG